MTMNINPHAAGLRRAEAAVADAERDAARARHALHAYDSIEAAAASNAPERELQAAEEHLESLQRKISAAQAAIENARRNLVRHTINLPGPPVTVSKWKYAVLGALGAGLVASGVGAAAGLAILESATAYALGAGAIGTATGVLGQVAIGKVAKTAAEQAQRDWADRRRHMEAQLKGAMADLETLLADIAQADADFRRIEAAVANKVAEHKRVDRDQLAAALAEAERASELPRAALREAQARYDDAHRKIAGLVDAIALLDARIAGIDDRIGLAERIKGQLDGATNSYSKRMAHDESRVAFNMGDPGKALDGLRSQRAGVDREKAKLEEVARGKMRIHQLGLKRVVIDGNNMCFYHGPKKASPPKADQVPRGRRRPAGWIGLAAIAAVAQELYAKSYEVVVVFDPSIRSLLGFGKTDVIEGRLAKRIGSEVAVLIAPEGYTADEYAVRESRASHSVAITKDGLAQLRAEGIRDQYPAVTEGRVFAHHMTGDPRRVAILELDIDASW